MNFYTCMTAGEWRNLCSVGCIRLLGARTVGGKEELADADYVALFSLAADRFLLSETSDLLIAEHATLRSDIEGVQPPGFSNGVRWLVLSDVIRFFPVREEDRWAFEPDAQKAQVALGDAIFDKKWCEWFKSQSTAQALMSGLILTKALEIPKADVDTGWVRALVDSQMRDEPVPAELDNFAAAFFRSRGQLYDLTREDSDSSAVFVSCAVEWANLYSDTDILAIDADFSELAYRLHEKYVDVPFSVCALGDSDMVDFHKRLAAMSPHSFPSEWTPSLISLYSRQNHRIRYGTVSPDDIVLAVRTIEKLEGSNVALLLSVLLGVALGPSKVHSIERSLKNEKFSVCALPPPVQSNSSVSLIDSENLECLPSVGVPDVQSDLPTLQSAPGNCGQC